MIKKKYSEYLSNLMEKNLTFKFRLFQGEEILTPAKE